MSLNTKSRKTNVTQEHSRTRNICTAIICLLKLLSIVKTLTLRATLSDDAMQTL